MNKHDATWVKNYMHDKLKHMLKKHTISDDAATELTASIMVWTELVFEAGVHHGQERTLNIVRYVRDNPDDVIKDILNKH